MRLCLIEDNAVPDIGPLISTRPVFELLLGARSLEARIESAFGIGPDAGAHGYMVRPHLVESLRSRRPRAAVNDPAGMGEGPILVANGRWVPDPGRVMASPARPGWVGLCEGLPACTVVGSIEGDDFGTGPIGPWFAAASRRHDLHDVGGWWVRRPWDLVARNAEHLGRDGAIGVGSGERRSLPVHSTITGPSDRLMLHATAEVEPYCSFDTRPGPITVSEGAVIRSFTCIEGPCYIGPGTQLFRASIRAGTTIGPNCRIGGEVEASIIQGYTNKYHEGFLGHSYVGEWVNLGALTSSSDLRNDYGEVSVPIGGYPIPTGLMKVGSFLGDFSRTGMGSLLNTGTVAGVMCNILPAGPLLPKHIPSFTSLDHGRISRDVSIERLFHTARLIKGRRGKEFTEIDERLFLDIYEQTRLERARAFQKQQAGLIRNQPIEIGVNLEH